MTESASDINKQTSESQIETTKEYRSIFKATSLFGGVKVYTILIGIIRTKFVAVLLGTVGVGILGLYQSTIVFIGGLTALGLSTSAVRDVSEANASGDSLRIGRTVSVLRRLVWITGLFGLLTVAVLSPLLSRVTFGNNDYTIPFVFLSVILLFDQISSGQLVVLQGMRRLKSLAKATAIGSTLGLIVSIPLYYWFGVKGIVPTLILNSATSLLLSWFYARKIPIKKVTISTKDALADGRMMLKMGIAMTVSNTLVHGCSYVLRWFIRFTDGIDEVGIFVAGFSLMSTYVGMIFTAMTTDYYPRLAAVNHDNDRCKDTINRQAELALMIIAPLMVAIVTFIPIVVNILYSSSFISVGDYIAGASLGLVFRTMGWPIAYVFIAKSESRLYLVNELVANIYCLILNILGYRFFGLLGLGISTSIGNGIYALQVYWLSHKRYDYKLSKDYLRLLISQVILLLIVVLLFYFIHNYLVYAFGSVLIIMSALISFKELNEKLDFRQMINQLRHGK